MPPQQACRKPSDTASNSPVTESTNGRVWRADRVPIAQESTLGSPLSLTLTHISANTTTNCAPGMQHSQQKAETLLTKTNVEDKLQAPGATAAADLSSARWVTYTNTKNWGALAIALCRGSSQPRDRTQVSHTAGGFFAIWATREPKQTRTNHEMYKTYWVVRGCVFWSTKF